ncbi:MAG: type III pantothenate kinase [Bradymonadales bacterium]|nr:type III pantothenate kinase [Bradymonadales bacterium]
MVDQEQTNQAEHDQRPEAHRHDLLLVVDVGNTNTVLGVFDDHNLQQHWRLQTRREMTADELGITLLQLLAAVDIAPSRITQGIVSSVVPPMSSRLQEMVHKYLAISLLVVGPGIRTGMPILYENPREVGADRIVNAVAAYERHPGGLIVVDFGTATTFDAVSPQGEYLGGAIAPGIAVAADALFRNAAMLPRVDIVRPSRVVGRNTIASMQAGILFGYTGLVSEIVRRMKQELRFPVHVIATGGLASLVAKETDAISEVVEHLTLEGLRIIFARNQDTSS